MKKRTNKQKMKKKGTKKNINKNNNNINKKKNKIKKYKIKKQEKQEQNPEEILRTRTRKTKTKKKKNFSFNIVNHTIEDVIIFPFDFFFCEASIQCTPQHHLISNSNLLIDQFMFTPALICQSIGPFTTRIHTYHSEKVLLCFCNKNMFSYIF